MHVPLYDVCMCLCSMSVWVFLHKYTNMLTHQCAYVLVCLCLRESACTQHVQEGSVHTRVDVWIHSP